MKSAARGVCTSPLRGGRRRGQTGATVVEAAFALPLFLLLVIACLWFGLAFSSYQSIVTAAREGARYGVAPIANSTPTPYALPTTNEIAQRSCNYLQTGVLGGLSQCSTYGSSSPPSITGCSDTTLTTGADNIYVGIVPVPYTIAYNGAAGSSTLNQTDVVVGIRKTVPVLGFRLHLTSCSAMRSENN